MSTLNGDQSQSAMEEMIDSGLTAEIKPNSKKRVLSKGDARYWLEGGRLFKNHDSAEYACRFTALGRREHFKLGTVKKKPRRRRRRRYIAPSRARDGWLLWRNSNPKRRSKGVKQLSKLEASGLIDEMLDTYGGSNRQGNHGGSNRRNGSAYNGSRSRKDAA